MAPVNATVTVTPRPSPDADYDAVIVVGQRAHLAASGPALHAHGFLPEARCAAGIAAVAPPSSPTSSSAPDEYIAGNDAVIATSAVASRHNSAVRPDALGAAVGSAVWPRGGACPARVLAVVVVDNAASSAVAVAAAVAAKLPTFTRRTGETAAVKCGVDLVVVGGGAADDDDDAQVVGLDDDAVARVQAVVDGVRHAAHLVDAPTNIVHTDRMVDEAKRVADDVGASIQIIRGEELREKGMGLIYGVGRAAEHPPALAILTYKANEAGSKVLAVVGKGIVYDTGGLSIKGKEGMPGMKRDMGGSAAVLGSFSAAVRSGVVDSAGVTLHAILCLAENAVDERATRPDDVHTAYSGLTVEINNTDAEGRLVLSDGCAFAAKDLGATHIVDIATLTGAQGIATGQRHAAIMTPSEGMEAIALAAGKSTGNLCFPVLYAPEFTRGEFHSAVADMKNSVKARNNAQVSCAGQFIGNHLAPFIANGGKWLHIDCASPAFNKSTERATGFGVALLVELVERIGRGEEEE